MPFCNGLTSTGEACPCQRFVPRQRKKGKSEKSSTKCECRHRENLHALEPVRPPQLGTSGKTTVAGVVDMYSADLGRLLHPTKATEDEARKEANTGFRKVVRDDERPVSKASMGRGGDTRFKASESGPKPSRKLLSKPVPFGRVVLLPYGVKSNNKLRSQKAPWGSADYEKLQKAGLAASRDGNDVLSFCKEWSSPAIDEWLRRLLPHPFEYLDARHGQPEEGQYHWKLLSRSRKVMDVVERPGDITGRDMFMVRGGPGKNRDDYVVHFSSVHRIPGSVYSNWQAAMGRVKEGLPEAIKRGEDLGDPTTDEDADLSDSENEGFSNLPSQRPKPRPAYKGVIPAAANFKGKGRAEPGSSSGSEASTDLEGDDDSEDEDAWKADEGASVSKPGYSTGEEEDLGWRKSERLLGKRKRSDQQSGSDDGLESDVEFVEGPSTKKARASGSNHTAVSPINVDNDEWLPLFLQPDPLAPSEPSTSSHISGNVGVAGLESPGKPRTCPWPSK
ncbi:hypothetical protein GLOTRDRAFT_134195 [Gloeophyllum trabeum ATCC 11539]|uniref:Uncharacterized protein n=1 Tax=Gloeophyllum trabeum (strain ATCC 11539 / FP-39264 / Madison 617) TaxID=670483 RepID=S7PQT1_GLOTA|nr:uncharacterized protein GLOTRDRAFT_134195 [Gloeophyllum trabeum ATCC 11539]EPQ50171.1 hypothetical protein GLOTRDRAFT_134195 [Gloeophyllum trabeum ATCC 11539]